MISSFREFYEYFAQKNFHFKHLEIFNFNILTYPNFRGAINDTTIK